MNDCSWDGLAANVVWDNQTKTWDDFNPWLIWGSDQPLVNSWMPDIPLTDGWIPDLPIGNPWTPEGPLVPC